MFKKKEMVSSVKEVPYQGGTMMVMGKRNLETTSLRLDTEYRDAAKHICEQNGATLGEVVNTFLKEFVMQGTMPFEPSRSNTVVLMPKVELTAKYCADRVCYGKDLTSADLPVSEMIDIIVDDKDMSLYEKSPAYNLSPQEKVLAALMVLRNIAAMRDGRLSGDISYRMIENYLKAIISSYSHINQFVWAGIKESIHTSIMGVTRELSTLMDSSFVSKKYRLAYQIVDSYLKAYVNRLSDVPSSSYDALTKFKLYILADKESYEAIVWFIIKASMYLHSDDARYYDLEKADALDDIETWFPKDEDSSDNLYSEDNILTNKSRYELEMNDFIDVHQSMLLVVKDIWCQELDEEIQKSVLKGEKSNIYRIQTLGFDESFSNSVASDDFIKSIDDTGLSLLNTWDETDCNSEDPVWSGLIPRIIIGGILKVAEECGFKDLKNCINNEFVDKCMEFIDMRLNAADDVIVDNEMSLAIERYIKLWFTCISGQKMRITARNTCYLMLNSLYESRKDVLENLMESIETMYVIYS